MARKDKNMFTKARWAKGKMSQTELADVMNVSRQTIVNWEEKRFEPSVSDIVKLSKTLDLSLDDICNYFNKEER